MAAESGFGFVGSGGTVGKGATFTVKRSIPSPNAARASATIALWCNRRRLAQVGLEARKTTRPLRTSASLVSRAVAVGKRRRNR